jgi:hypothetical protein
MILVATLAIAHRSSGGVGTLTGREPRIWNEGNISVIAATVAEVTKGEGEGHQPYRATLVPLATLAGSFDPSLRPALRVRFYVSSLTSSVENAPPNGATVLAVIETSAIHGDETTASDWVRSDVCRFMPDGSALVVLKDLNDPRLGETLKRLQDARAHPDADPHRKVAPKADH